MKANYLTSIRDYYGFRTKKNTAYVLVFTVIGGLLFGSAFVLTQVALFVAGLILNKLYP